MKFIGSKLKHLREIKNMSMTELTELTGIKQGYISEIEIVLKYHFPVVPESGGGGGTPHKVLLYKVSA